MLQEFIRSLRKHRLRRYVQRSIKVNRARLFSPIDRKTLVKVFRSLGIEKGITVCCHSSLSRLGYIVGGAETVIDALKETVGNEGCILMPSFAMTGSQESFLSSGKIFDVRNSPSKAGLITEKFRLRPDVLRSLHPTVSTAGWGDRANEILHGHEKSVFPYGQDTPYGKIVEREDSFILMLETHIQSLLHHLQNRVNLPSLFLSGLRKAKVINYSGKTINVTTKVMRPKIPYFIAIPSSNREDPEWVRIQDFSLLFPSRRSKECKALGYCFDGYPKIYKRRNYFEDRGVLRSKKIGEAEIGLLHVKSFISLIEPELIDLIENYREYYDPDRIDRLNMPLPGG